MLKLNIGLSYPEQSFEDELKKLALASKYNIDFVSVISIDKERIIPLWEAVKKSEALKHITLCSAPIYESILLNEDIKDTIKRQASYGVTAMTFHITPVALLKEAEVNGYVINSRGGQFIREKAEEDPNWENPFYKDLSELIRYAYNCGVRQIFFGTSLRPGACEKASKYTLEELRIACEMYDNCNEFPSPCIEYEIEAFGHVPVSEFPIYHYILGSRQVCAMGPLLTDAVNGYDELNAIIGYTLALKEGFNITTECMLSRSEHIKMPTVEDVEDECQKWRVARLVNGLANDWWDAYEEEEPVIAKKEKQRTQCSAHINIFGAMDIQETCNVCGDKCPLLKLKKKEANE